MQFQSLATYEKKSSTLLRDAFSWLTGTATTKDVNAIRSRINQLISMQQNQQKDHGSYDINTQCYQIYYPNEQAIYQHFNGYNREDTSGYNNLVQYYTFSIQKHQLPANSTTHQICHGPTSRIAIHYMREIALHAMDISMQPLQDTVTTHPTCSRSEEDVEVTLRIHSLPQCTCQFPLKTPYISTDIYTPTS